MSAENALKISEARFRDSSLSGGQDPIMIRLLQERSYANEHRVLEF